MNKESKELLEKLLELNEEDDKIEIKIKDSDLWEKAIAALVIGSIAVFFGGLGAFFWVKVGMLLFGG